MNRRQNTVRFHTGGRGLLTLILLSLALPSLIHAEQSAKARDPLNRLAEKVRNLRARLQITDDVEVRIDEKNDKLVSSEHLEGLTHGYRISFDRQFLETLDDDEIQAAIAHELGHVWIFSHHPFLQTEELANEIAMRAISREIMKKIYLKLWTRTGVAGNLEMLLGPEAKPDTPKAAVLLP